MTWKSTAAASGLMLVATWLASHAPTGGPREAPASPAVAHTESAAAEIQREAERLHGRLKEVASFSRPARNPFRFGDRPALTPPSAGRPPIEAPEPVVAEQPPTLRIALSGIGEETIDGQMVLTAFVSSPDDVYIVKVGDTVAGLYKVTAITATSLDLARLDDGTAVTLTLRP